VTAAFNFCLNLVVVFVFILAWGVEPTWSWLLFPVAMVALFVLTAAVSMLLSALFVRFRDVAIIWAVAAQMLFYATPVLYPLGPKGINDPSVEKVLMLNPLGVLFEQVRIWVLSEPASVAPSPAEAAGGKFHLLPAVVIYVGVCALGAWYFNREAPRIAEDL
jgi:ABC-2 type transport system permease protein